MLSAHTAGVKRIDVPREGFEHGTVFKIHSEYYQKKVHNLVMDRVPYRVSMARHGGGCRDRTDVMIDLGDEPLSPVVASTPT